MTRVRTLWPTMIVAHAGRRKAHHIVNFRAIVQSPKNGDSAICFRGAQPDGDNKHGAGKTEPVPPMRHEARGQKGRTQTLNVRSAQLQLKHENQNRTPAHGVGGGLGTDRMRQHGRQFQPAFRDSYTQLLTRKTLVN
jgi:hypothetical protein